MNGRGMHFFLLATENRRGEGIVEERFAIIVSRCSIVSMATGSVKEPLLHNLSELPHNLPAPQDDGKADHLTGSRIPSVSLPAINGESAFVDLSRIPGRVVVLVWPRTGRPDQPPLVPDWDDIPGARGCTPQVCRFRDLHKEFKALGLGVYGLSAQHSEYQKEMVERLHIPFPVLSDSEFHLARAMSLPTLDIGGLTLLKRLVWVADDGRIVKTFYPVFPPDQSADAVLKWLFENPRGQCKL
mmetsp:Transcript_35923/g.59865  ORF Transcript_35923/g.59865 Transcript_35923/m.59865 type:complete len:242 (-) Transcript_35923:164-889(-)